MRKALLLITSVLIFTGASAQQNLPFRNEAQLAKMRLIPNSDGIPYANQNQITRPKLEGGGLRTVSETKFSSSFNGFMLLVSESQVLTLQNDLNMLSFTQRACKSFEALGGNTGWIQTSTSIDNGLTWDTSLVIMSQDDPNRCRYPSGGIYNPAGNTDPNSAYAVVAGPITDGGATNTWKGYFYGSMKLDSTNNNQQTLHPADGDFLQYMPRYSFKVCRDKAFVLGIDYNINENLTSTPYDNAVINRGVFNSTTNSFDWTQIAIPLPFAGDSYYGYDQFSNFGSLAFSEDGSIGYFVVIGVDQDNPLGYYPIIYKSIDFGQTWNKEPFYDFRDMSVWAEHLWQPTDGTESKPFFTTGNGIDALVDADGNLHIVSTIASSYSNNYDSIGFTYSEPRPQIWDVYQHNGQWEAVFVDSILTDGGVISEVWYSSDGSDIYVDARLQASLSQDRTKAFMLWVDSDPSFNGLNDYPDIRGYGFEIGNSSNNTGIIPFTEGTQYTYYNFWMYVSDVATSSGNGIYTVPATVSYSRDQSYDMASTMDHYYVSDLSFPLLTGVNDPVVEDFAVSQNFPNPFTEETRFDITLGTAENLELTVSNILGQEVWNRNVPYSSGTHSVIFNRAHLTSGVYNFTVNANGKKTSRTMIIE